MDQFLRMVSSPVRLCPPVPKYGIRTFASDDDKNRIVYSFNGFCIRWTRSNSLFCMHNPEKRNGCSASSVRRSALAER